MKAIFKGKTYNVVCECDGTEWESDGTADQWVINTTGRGGSDLQPVLCREDKGSSDWCDTCYKFMWIDTNNPL